MAIGNLLCELRLPQAESLIQPEIKSIQSEKFYWQVPKFGRA